MAINDFYSLTINEKANAVWSGLFISSTIEEGFTSAVYQIDAFYVEVIYDPLSNSIIDFRAFNNLKL